VKPTYSILGWLMFFGLLACLSGCHRVGPVVAAVPPHKGRPLQWTRNHQGNWGGGSCHYAAVVDCLRVAGLSNKARYFRGNYAGGIGEPGMTALLRRHKIKHHRTTKGDVALLEWASRTRRPAAIHYYSMHAITFWGFNSRGEAVLGNNNDVGHKIRVPKAKFLTNWNWYGRQYGHSGGVAIVLPYAPAPPEPRRRA